MRGDDKKPRDYMDRRWDTGHQTKLQMGTGHDLQPYDPNERVCL